MNLRWPWVSRLALDMALEERDNLRRQNAELLDHVRRMDRVEHGVGELPRQPRPPLEPMPQDLREFFDQFSDPAIGRMQRNEALRMHARGKDWASIKQQVMIPKDLEAGSGQPKER